MVRKYEDEMNMFVDQAKGRGGPYIPRKLAEEIVDKLRATDAELLKGWLDQRAIHFVHQLINDRDRAQRAHVRHTHMRGVFAKAAQKYDESGHKDTESLNSFLNMPFAVADGSKRQLRDLRAGDLAYVGSRYEQRENQNKMWKHFVRALAQRVGDQRVGEVFTEEQLREMFKGLGGSFGGVQ